MAVQMRSFLLVVVFGLLTLSRVPVACAAPVISAEPMLTVVPTAGGSGAGLGGGLVGGDGSGGFGTQDVPVSTSSSTPTPSADPSDIAHAGRRLMNLQRKIAEALHSEDSKDAAELGLTAVPASKPIARFGPGRHLLVSKSQQVDNTIPNVIANLKFKSQPAYKPRTSGAEMALSEQIAESS